MRMCATNALLLFRIDLKRLMNEDVSEHEDSLLVPDIRNSLLQFELPLNESQTNTFKNPSMLCTLAKLTLTLDLATLNVRNQKVL